LLTRYLARSLVDGSPAAAGMFDEMVELTEQWVTRHYPGITADPKAYAAVLCAMQIGMLTLHDSLSRVLGADMLSPQGHLRVSKAAVDFYSHPLLTPELAAQVHAAYGRLQAQGAQP
jgi:TetR/AcrR family transcriptional regulator, regulator of cefoperazone and chloramphenicol sensitivity